MAVNDVLKTDNFETARQKWNASIQTVNSGITDIDFSSIQSQLTTLSGQVDILTSGLNNIDFSSLENEIYTLSGQLATVVNNVYGLSGQVYNLNGSPTGTVLISVAGITTKRSLRSSDILPDFAVSTFSLGTSTVLVGSIVVTPSFTATYNDTVDSATLSDNYGTADKTLGPVFTSFSSNGSFVRNTPAQTVIFTLAAISSGYAANRTATLTWNNNRFYGVSSSGAATEVFIESLTSELSNSRAKTFAVTAGVSQKIYYSYPSRLGTATFTVGGFEGGFNLLGTVSVTNSSGFNENYYLYESTNANLGTTTVVVS